VRLHGALKHHVILWIAAHPIHDSCYFDTRSAAGVFLQGREDFFILPGELPHKRGANFRNDLIAIATVWSLNTESRAA
jgi:hypothetical protein